MVLDFGLLVFGFSLQAAGGVAQLVQSAALSRQRLRVRAPSLPPIWKLHKRIDLGGLRLFFRPKIPPHSPSATLTQNGHKCPCRVSAGVIVFGAGIRREGYGGGRIGSTWHCRIAISRSMADDTVNDQRRLPDPKTCRTRNLKYLGPVLGLSHCLVKYPYACEYAARFDNKVFCRHPDRRSFEKTDPP